MAETKSSEFHPIREKIHEIIFEADTPLGKQFDIALMICIGLSVIVVMLESVSYLDQHYHQLFFVLEWVFTIIFTIEYILRLYCVYRPLKYATSFFGIIDLLAIIPTYISLFLAGTQYLLVIRTLRLMRVFRIFKLGKFLKEGNLILLAMRASQAKITVFLVFVVLMVTIIGSIMYLIEGGSADSNFTSIPRSIYWAIVTLTTVGYGDIAPTTEFGQFLASIVMIMGYAVIAVPTGIVSAEFINKSNAMSTNTQCCRYCSQDGHDDDAVYCKYCGEVLNEEPPTAPES
ncbi:MAG: ion transporter [Bacteroidota bacterium]